MTAADTYTYRRHPGTPRGPRGGTIDATIISYVKVGPFWGVRVVPPMDYYDYDYGYDYDLYIYIYIYIHTIVCMYV